MEVTINTPNIVTLGWCLKNLLSSEERYRVIGIVENHLPALSSIETSNDTEKTKTTETDILARINRALLQVENFTKPNWGATLNENLKYSSELFELDEKELSLLGFSFNSFKNGPLKKLGDDILALFKDVEKTISLLLDISHDDVLKIIAPSGSLQESGLIKVDMDDLEEGLCSQYGAIATTRVNVSSMYRRFPDKDAWISNLLGEETHATLSYDMFSHVGKDLDVALAMLKGYRQAHKSHLGLNILLFGFPGTGKTELAKTLCQSAEMSCWSVGEADQQGNEPRRVHRILSLKTSMSILQKNLQSVVLFDEAEDILGSRSSFGDEKGNVSKIYINNLISKNKIPVIWTCNSIAEMDLSVLRRMSIIINVKPPNQKNRVRIWDTLLDERYPVGASERLAKSWPIPPALASSAVEVNNLAGGNEETLNTIIGGVVSVMGTSHESEYDIGVYQPQLTVCRDDLNQFADKLKNTKISWNMCLYGPSGTGKSLYGHFLADKIGMQVLHRRASDILSKWSGESEQNIARLFIQAKIERKIILIDEIEGLVFDRRLANKGHEVSLVNEFLSQLDTHDLPFIATSNIMEVIDEAMLRRFTFKFKFDYLTPAKRQLAYREILNLPAPDIELPSGLTPADFKNVKKKMDVLDNSDHITILRWLTEELEVKKLPKDKIGFSFKEQDIDFKSS